MRVAFRKNSVTGQALSVDSTEDGYVHEKWFVMEDSQGDRLMGSGSLNESRTALTKKRRKFGYSLCLGRQARETACR